MADLIHALGEPGDVDVAQLTHERENVLLRAIGEFPRVLTSAGTPYFHGIQLDLGSGLLEGLVRVTERARLLGTARRVVLRIEIQDDVLLPLVLGDVGHLHARVGELEGWSWLAYM